MGQGYSRTGRRFGTPGVGGEELEDWLDAALFHMSGHCMGTLTNSMGG
jgi:hypothetical protein